MKKKSNSKVVIAVVSAVAIVIGGLTFKRIREKQEAVPRIEALANVSAQEKAEMLNLYQKRMQLLLDWEKSVKTNTKKLSAQLTLPEKFRQFKAEWTPDTASELERFDSVQNEITGALSNYLQLEEARKFKPKDLESLEEKINRIRRSYHSNAFEANALIEKYHVEREQLPTFRAEQELLKAGMWNSR